MSSRAPSTIGLALLVVASMVTAGAALVVAGRRVAERRADTPHTLPVASIEAADAPIAAEARVFRTSAGALAISPFSDARREAHPRSLRTYRGLRAYSGAPPRIPHGLTPAEFRTGGCNTCHERGGFSLRFGAYVPLTPHPEMGACLQCHVGDAKLMAIALPRTDPSDRCKQCHTAGAMRWRDSSLAWTGLAAPEMAAAVPGRTPPPIPHPLQMRENCLACHASPGGVAELRTPHPERANCRQCHLEGSTVVRPFMRPAPAAVAGGSGPS